MRNKIRKTRLEKILTLECMTNNCLTACLIDIYVNLQD